ncbi:MULTISPECIES: thioesterase family protein [Psychrobacter]|uniref:thioesterase family protein n=1 Tax=Psychrobacter TaxID=497 RepID=UPI00191A7293|nr:MULTISPECIES: thioesterase family protein [Psychrobacter]
MTNQKISSTANLLQQTTPLFATDYHIYINHTDAGGIVYHANHLVFFENCRRDWFTKIGLNTYFLQADDGQIQHFVVSQAELQYRKAIFLDEIITVQIDKVDLKPASIIFYQSIHRQSAAADSLATTSPSSSLLSSARIVIACVQNQIKSETPSPIENSADNQAATQAPAAAPSAAPIRPIRVPKKLHHLIEQAMIQHAQGQ